MRRFQLERDTDIVGISGIGVIAGGVEFPGGKISMQWNGPIASISIWDSIDEVLAIHGHDGDTRIVWLDAKETEGDD